MPQLSRMIVTRWASCFHRPMSALLGVWADAAVPVARHPTEKATASVFITATDKGIRRMMPVLRRDRLHALAPHRRRRLVRCPHHRVLRQLLHCFGYCSLELCVVPGCDVFGPIFHLNVRRDALVLDGPFVVHCEEPAARREHDA